MKTDRRKFIQTMGAGAAGLGLTANISSFTSEGNKAAKAVSGTRKMIVQADDVGFSNVCNIGSFKTVEEGVVTAMDVMLDCPGAVDALERLKKLPWISVGWHMHMWGGPVLDPKEVPSLVEKDGQFAGRFITDISQSGSVVFDEAVRELRAQLDRCIRVLGRVPDTGGGGRGNSPWGRALQQVSEEYGLSGGGHRGHPDVDYAAPYKEKYNEYIRAAKAAGEEWAKYYTVGDGRPPMGSERPPDSRMPPMIPDNKETGGPKIITAAGTTAYIDLLTDSISAVEAKYDPVLFYTEDRAGILKYPLDVITLQSWHPGYVDYYVYRLGERANRARAQQFVVGRVQDVAALCDDRLKNWIKENNIELVNRRDAMYGSREYQNHLRIIGSDLAVG